jgi:hypothetical protein
MGSMMKFNFSFSTLTMEIFKGWLTRPSLLRTRLKRWRRMASGKCHSLDSLQEATRGLACLSPTLSSEHRTWFDHQCMVNALSSRCSDLTSSRNVQISRCRDLSSKHLDSMCSNHLARTYSKFLAQLLQPRIMHQLKKANMVVLVSSVV